MRGERGTRRAGVGKAVLPLLVGALVLGIRGAAEAPGRHGIAGTRPARATAEADKGAAPGQRRGLLTCLPRRPRRGRARRLRESGVGSRLGPYGEYLSAEQARARFGVTKAQTTVVRSWLTSAGLKAIGVTRHYVSVTGHAAAATGKGVRIAVTDTYASPTGAGRHRLQLVGRHRGHRDAGHRDRLRPALPFRRGRGHRLLLLLW